MLGRTPLSDDDASKIIVADSELNVARRNAGLLVVAGSVAGQLKNLSAQVLQHSSEVHGRTTADAGSITPLTKKTRHAAKRKLKTSLGAARHGASFAFTTPCRAFSLLPLVSEKLKV